MCFFTSQAEKNRPRDLHLLSFKVSTVGQKPFLLLGRGGIGEVLVPFDSHEVSCFCFVWCIFDGIIMHGISVDHPAIGWGDSLVALADSKCSLEFWQHRIWMRCFPNFQGRVVLVWKHVCFPKGSWKRSLPAAGFPSFFGADGCYFSGGGSGNI